MKKSLMAAALILFIQFALAEEVFYIVLDHETKECRVVNGAELASTLIGERQTVRPIRNDG